jgi:hypothetical protein
VPKVFEAEINQLNRGHYFEKIRASWVSRKVLKRIISGVLRGHVVGIFDRSFNIEVADGFIINIGTDKLPLTPRAVSVSDKNFSGRILPNIFL